MADPSTHGANEQFISEAITPVPGTMDTTMMARGEAGLPRQFTWRGRRYEVEQLFEKWKQDSPAEGGERYLRRHWFMVRTTDGLVMKLYCERQPNLKKRPKQRWWIYALVGAP